jgi:hypothetical protein
VSSSAEVSAVRAAFAAQYLRADSTLKEYADLMAYFAVQGSPPVVVPPVVVPPAPAGWNPKATDPSKVVFPFAPHTTSVVEGDLNLTVAGQVVSGVAVTGNIITHAKDVKLDNFTAQGLWNQSSGLYAKTGKLAGSHLDAGVQYSEYTLEQVEITGSFDGVKSFSNTHLVDCWIHQLIAGGGYDPSPTAGGSGNSAGGYTHDDGGQISSGANISYLRCRIEDTGYNSGLFIDPDQGAITNVTFDDGFLQGGNFGYFAVHSASAAGAPFPTRLAVRNSTLDYPAITAPAFAGTNKVETDRGIDIIWVGNVHPDGTPCLLNEPATPLAKRTRKHVWSYA